MHLGIIMDGNRRWADEGGFSYFEGHRAGAEKVRQVAKWCKNRGIKTLTLYAFSTENWVRSQEEVDSLMQLMDDYLTNELNELQKEKAELRVIGQKRRLSTHLQKKIEEAENLTKNNEALTLVLAISYGGRAEIIEAVKKIVRDGIKPEDITEETISQRLWTAGLPDPDLIIRTSGEKRTSGFLLWQAAYAELYFTDKNWPDFSEKDLDAALAEYDRRQRRFGK